MEASTVNKIGLYMALQASQSPAYLVTQGVPHVLCLPPKRRRRGGGGLLASNNDDDDDDDDEGWQCLVDPFLSAEERLNSIDPEASDQGDPDMDDEVTDNCDDLPEEMIEFLTVVFKKPMKQDRRRKLVTKYPRPSTSQTTPPSIDKSMLALTQKRKNIVSHDRFLGKLQRFASDAVGPLMYLLKELQSGRGVTKDRAIPALQAALCFIGNAFATLSVERRHTSA